MRKIILHEFPVITCTRNGFNFTKFIQTALEDINKHISMVTGIPGKWMTQDTWILIADKKENQCAQMTEWQKKMENRNWNYFVWMIYWIYNYYSNDFKLIFVNNLFYSIYEEERAISTKHLQVLDYRLYLLDVYIISKEFCTVHEIE